MEGENSLLTAIKASLTRPSWVIMFLLFTVIALFGLQISKDKIIIPPLGFISGLQERRAGLEGSHDKTTCSDFFTPLNPPRKVVRSIADFGGVGDGKTSNTAAFRRAVEFMEAFRESGGAQLNVSPGRWLTGSFNLTSNFTLFLQHGAVILGSQEADEWPIIKPLPSYGRGRERLGGRHISLIHGDGLSNVVITDSSTNVCIEDCYIESGDDLVAVKSGWDQYGIKTARPSSNIIVQRVSGTTPTCSGVGIGSEMSGGVSNVVIKDVRVRDSAAGVLAASEVFRELASAKLDSIVINDTSICRRRRGSSSGKKGSCKAKKGSPSAIDPICSLNRSHFLFLTLDCGRELGRSS
nr:probable polygalacturonase [Ipomoea batatas]